MSRYSALLAAVLAVLLVASSSYAAAIVQISNQASSTGEPAVANAGELALTLFFTNVIVTADDRVEVTETVDLSSGIAGPTVGNLFLNTPRADVLGDVRIGGGLFVFGGSGGAVGTANLGGVLLDSLGTSLLDRTRFASAGIGGVSTVNVSAGGDVWQGAEVAADGAVVNVLGGQFLSASIDRDVSLGLFGLSHVEIGSGSLDATTIDVHDSAVLAISGHGFSVDSGTGFVSVGPGELASQSGVLRGTLSSGESFEAAFSQGGGGATGTILLLPEPGVAWLCLIGLVALSCRMKPRAGAHRAIIPHA